MAKVGAYVLILSAFLGALLFLSALAYILAMLALTAWKVPIPFFLLYGPGWLFALALLAYQHRSHSKNKYSSERRIYASAPPAGVKPVDPVGRSTSGK